MPTRILRDGILESERVDALSVDAELFYRRLMSRADDYGRYTADPVLLRSNLYPRRVDRVTIQQIETWLAECCDGNEPLVQVYEVFGKPYLQIVNFGQRVRSESKYPPAPEMPPSVSNVREMRTAADNGGQRRTIAAIDGPTRARGRTESETNSKTNAKTETTDAAPKAPPVGDVFVWFEGKCRDAGIVVEPDLWRDFPGIVNTIEDVGDLYENLDGWLVHPRYSGGVVTARKLAKERQWKYPAVLPNARSPGKRRTQAAVESLGDYLEGNP